MIPPGERGFWNSRLGTRALRARLLERPIAADVGWLHTLGSVSLVLLLVLIGTGVLLTLSYSASAEHAYHSIRYIENVVAGGSLVRGLHHWAASFLIITITVHLVHSFLHFAFTRPREFTWCTGVLLLLVVLAFGFTGYLLPWDEKAYWATVVGTNLVSQFPLAGDFILRVVRGGVEVGAATLSRFYGVHVGLLPVLLVVSVGVHLYLVVLHGISSKGERHGASRRSVRFWPDTVAMDAAAILLVLALLFFVALRVGAPLEAPADPTNTEYVPRPEWYFLPLFQLLTLFPGSVESIVAIGVPLGLVTVLVLLPWWSRPLLRRTWTRRTLLGGAVTLCGGVVALGMAGAKNVGPTFTPEAPQVARGRLLFDQLGCRNCHSIRGVGGIVGPDLTLVGFRRPDSIRLVQHLHDPRSIVPTSPMPAMPLEGESQQDLVAFLLSLGNELRHTTAAKAIFEEKCVVCHRLAGRGGTFGPDLSRVGQVRTVAYVHQYVEEPTSLNADAQMPPVVALTHEQVEDVSRYVVATALAAYGSRSRR